MAQAIQKMSADALRAYGETLRRDTLDSNPITTDNVVQPIEGRPDVEELYKRLNLLNRQPLDYSGLENVNRNRTQGGDRDFIGGMALQMLGGSAGASAGKHVLEEAMKARNPIRPNAADVGWIDPETGKLVENPQMRRAGDEKLITGRIDALIREEERKANIALAAGRAEESRVHQRNMEILAGQKTGLQSITIVNPKGDGSDKMKDISSSSRKKMEETAADYRVLEGLGASFKDSYSGGVTGTPGGELTSSVMTNFPVAGKFVADTVGKGKQFDAAMESAEWWRAQKRLDEIPARHAAFGSAFTATEKAAWDGASIQQGMTGKQIRDAIAIRQKVLKSKAERLARTEVAERRRPESVSAALDGIVDLEGGGAAPAAAGGAEMSPEQKAILDAYRKKKAGGK